LCLRRTVNTSIPSRFPLPRISSYPENRPSVRRRCSASTAISFLGSSTSTHDVVNRSSGSLLSRGKRGSAGGDAVSGIDAEKCGRVASGSGRPASSALQPAQYERTMEAIVAGSLARQCVAGGGKKQGQGSALNPLGPEAPDPVTSSYRFQGLVLGGVQGRSPSLDFSNASCSASMNWLVIGRFDDAGARVG
jgi:hypothetical protein